MRLREMPPEQYVRDVLPLTAVLWAGRRSYDEYVAQTLEIARGTYGRRYFRTLGLYDGASLVASFKRYERTFAHEGSRLRGVGFGAVFTPGEYRGRGYASVMLAMALDDARSRGYDLAYLFSDIRPQFYEALGFVTLPSRRFSLRADALAARRVTLGRLEADDWSAVRRIFELGERRRATALLRTASAWDWIRMRMRHGSEHPAGEETNLVVRHRRGIVAYVFGARSPDRDAYLLDEFGCADDGSAAIPSLLRAAAGDLRRITGWLPPGDARGLLPRLAVRRRSAAIFMMAALRPQSERLRDAIANADSDFCWASDHV
jgi:GNAT superfamily N-acetyltransferase